MISHFNLLKKDKKQIQITDFTNINSGKKGVVMKTDFFLFIDLVNKLLKKVWKTRIEDKELLYFSSEKAVKKQDVFSLK